MLCIATIPQERVGFCRDFEPAGVVRVYQWYLSLLNSIETTTTARISLYLYRLKSTGYDMLKQGGKWQASGATHDDLTQEFMEFFDHDAFDIVDEHCQGSENYAREILSNAFQVGSLLY